MSTNRCKVCGSVIQNPLCTVCWECSKGTRDNSRSVIEYCDRMSREAYYSRREAADPTFERPWGDY